MKTLTSAQIHSLADLVVLRHAAKKTIQNQTQMREIICAYKHRLAAAVARGDLKAQALAKIDLDTCREKLLEIDFQIIDLGQAFSAVAQACDELLPRELWLRALSVNESEWQTPLMQKHGNTIGHVVSVLNLENSATRGDAIEHKPLNWCLQMAMMNAMKTNPKFGKFAHELCNESLDGAFGVWKEPSVLERLGAKNHAA